MPTPAEVLDIDPGADRATVEAAYRERVTETHPDQGGSREAFQRVRAAYEAMLDGDVRADLDDREPEMSEPEAPEGTVVEYLDYEVLADHGWSLEDADIFAQASQTDLAPADGGRFRVEPGESLLEGAERCGYTWPYSCRGGACANCAVKVLEGDLSQPVNHILPDDLVERGIRLSCVGEPITDELHVVYNVKHLPDVEELLLPPGPFERANPDF